MPGFPPSALPALSWVALVILLCRLFSLPAMSDDPDFAAWKDAFNKGDMRAAEAYARKSLLPATAANIENICPPAAGPPPPSSATTTACMATQQRPAAAASSYLTAGALSKPADESLLNRKRKALDSCAPLEPGKPQATQPATPTIMRHRLRSRLSFWKTFAISQLVLSWVEFGFDLRWRPETGAPAPANFPNHPSALANPSFVSKALEELVLAGSIEPCWERPRVVSALGLVPKKGADGWRLIWDGRYVNSHLQTPSFQYEGLEAMPDILQPNDYMITLDLCKGFHHIDIQEEFWTFLGFEWEGQFYMFTSLPFGLASAPWAFTKVTREIIRKWRRAGHRCSGYIDDSIHAAQEAGKLAAFVAQVVIPDLENCGFLVNLAKSALQPQQQAKYLGMIIDTVAGCMRVIADKRQGILKMIKEALDHRLHCSVLLLQRITGNLISLHWAFGPISRLMTLSIYANINALGPEQGFVKLSATAIRDLTFWLTGFSTYEGFKQMWPPTAIKQTIEFYSDAAGKSPNSFGGWGGWTTDPQGTIKVAKGIWGAKEGDASSTLLELSAVWNIIRSFNCRGSWDGNNILVKTDNQGIFFIINKAGSHVPEIHDICKELFWYCLTHGINLRAIWIPRELNTWADFYSKLVESCDWMLNHAVFDAIQQQWGAFDIDLFASYTNHQVNRYYSLYWTPDCEGVDAFNYSWQNVFGWCYPPFCLISRVISHAQGCKARLGLLCPFTPSAVWWTRLARDANHFQPFVLAFTVLGRAPMLILPGRRGYQPGPPPAWPLIALHLDFVAHRTDCLRIPSGAAVDPH